MKPIYLNLPTGELRRRADVARALLRSCCICPRICNVDRLAEQKGFCQTGSRAIVSSFSPHFGEERPLVGQRGSGTIFFSSCNLRCVFCQNYEISHLPEGDEVEPETLAEIMPRLQRLGCHNINFVTPSHVAPQILEALAIAAERGLQIPLVYNSGGYDSIEELRLLDGVVDIYMPDLKCMDRGVAREYLNAEDYPEIAKAAIREMHRQVGDLVLDERGIAVRGLLVRHLVMPNDLAQTEEAMQFLAREIGPNTYVNLMNQYRPCGLARDYPLIRGAVTPTEYQSAIEAARRAGIQRLD